MYDLTVKTGLNVLRPTRALAGDEIRPYVTDALASVGRRLPAAIADPEFAERLAETGEYDEDLGDIKITVRRAH